MIEEGENNKKKKKKNKEDKLDKDEQDFMDDIQADKELQKKLNIYKNEDRLKHMTKEELDNEIQDLQIIGLMQDMDIKQPEKEQNAVNEE